MMENRERHISDIPWDERRGYVESGERSGCALLDSFLEDPMPQVCREVIAIRNNGTRRRYVEAALLTQSPYADIADTLDMPEGVIEAYALVYYDVAAMDRLSRIELIESLTDHEEKNFKIWTLTQGLDFLAWRLGKKVNISPVEGLSQLMSDSYFKAKEAFFNGSTTSSGAQALKWTKQTVEIAKVLKAWVTDNDEARKDIELALKGFTGGSNEEGYQFDLIENLDVSRDYGDSSAAIDAEFEQIPPRL